MHLNPYVPPRWCGVKVMIDTNAINAKQRIAALNQIERWRADEVIMLLMPEPAYVEAIAGDDDKRRAKAGTQVRTNSSRITAEQKARFSAIERALFPEGAADDSQRNDVEIVFQAADWGYILVTSDGDSKRQPRGILGARDELAALGITAMRPEEALDHIRSRISDRDRRVAANCAATKTLAPQWLGKD